MSLFEKLFGKKKSPELSFEKQEQQKNKWEGFEFFQRGKECYLKRQTKEALSCFDKAFENGFVQYFSNEASNLYFMRALCLQDLKYDYDAIDDFDKSIELSPPDCNSFFSRSVSKGAILDYEGEIADLEKAIKFSKIESEINNEYNDEARKLGYRKGVAGLCEARLAMAKVMLGVEMNEEERAKLLNGIKKRRC